MLKLKLQYFDHLMWRADSLEKTLMLGKTEHRRRVTEDEMVGWHHWLNRHELEQILGDSDGQGSLACCSPRSLKESVGQDLVTEQWTLSIWRHFLILTPWVQLNRFGRRVQTVQWESQGLNFSSTIALESLEQDNFSEPISPTKPWAAW